MQALSGCGFSFVEEPEEKKHFKFLDDKPSDLYVRERMPITSTDAIIIVAIFYFFRWVFRKIKNGIGRAIDYVSSGEMAEDRKRCKYKAWKRRQKKLDAALKDGSVDHDTYVRAQIWLEKIRDWETSNERLKRDP